MDRMLEIFADMANGVPGEDGKPPAEASVTLTLIVSGQVISGRTTSARSYVSRFSNEFASDLVTIGLSGEKAIDWASDVDKVAPEFAPGFLHLKDVTVWHGAHKMTSDQIWRIRLDAISAYVLGIP